MENSSLVKVMHSGHSLSYELPNFYLAKFSSVTDVIHQITSCRKLCHQVVPECNSTNTLNKSQNARPQYSLLLTKLASVTAILLVSTKVLRLLGEIRRCAREV